MKNHNNSAALAFSASVFWAMSGISTAAGYKLPETSTNATALSAAYIANAEGPDASYYNPAGMALNADGGAVRGDLTLVHLPSISFRGTQNPPLAAPGTDASDSSRTEDIAVPTFHYLSPFVGNARFGLSMVTPGGLSKRWTGYGARAAEEFSLQTVELNPTIGYRISDQLAVGAGGRMLYSSGVVKSRIDGSIFRDLEGDSVDFGYNLAIHYEPTDAVAFAATYRSKIDLTVEGDARLGSGAATLYDGDARVTIPLPAALAVAAAFDVRDDTTVEFVYERTYWSAYKDLDFEYGAAVPAGLVPFFDDPIAKDWKDSNTYRLGVTHRLNETWTLMGGLAYDESPAPPKTIGFELPESDGMIFSLGARYQASKNLEIDGAVLYTKREKLELSAGDNDNALSGEFTDAGALLVSLGAFYRFD
jgi:long-chain fatty acid transport protein